MGFDWQYDLTVENIQDWFVLIFRQKEEHTCKQILMTMWSLWHARTQHVMEGKRQTAQEITIKVGSLLKEVEEVSSKLPEQRGAVVSVQQPPMSRLLK